MPLRTRSARQCQTCHLSTLHDSVQVRNRTSLSGDWHWFWSKCGSTCDAKVNVSHQLLNSGNTVQLEAQAASCGDQVSLRIPLRISRKQSLASPAREAEEASIDAQDALFPVARRICFKRPWSQLRARGGHITSGARIEKASKRQRASADVPIASRIRFKRPANEGRRAVQPAVRFRLRSKVRDSHLWHRVGAVEVVFPCRESLARIGPFADECGKRFRICTKASDICVSKDRRQDEVMVAKGAEIHVRLRTKVRIEHISKHRNCEKDEPPGAAQRRFKFNGKGSRVRDFGGSRESKCLGEVEEISCLGTFPRASELPAFRSRQEEDARHRRWRLVGKCGGTRFQCSRKLPSRRSPRYRMGPRSSRVHMGRFEISRAKCSRPRRFRVSFKRSVLCVLGLDGRRFRVSSKRSVLCVLGLDGCTWPLCRTRCGLRN